MASEKDRKIVDFMFNPFLIEYTDYDSETNNVNNKIGMHLYSID